MVEELCRISRDVVFRNTRTSEERTLRLRPVTPDDDLREQHFVDGMDPSSHEMRFFGPKRAHSKKETKGLTHIDYREDFALCCLNKETDEFVGIARYYSLSHDPRSPNHDVVEVAVVIDDSFRGFGLGLYLTYQLLDVAVHEGKTEAVAEVLHRNRGARRLFERLMACIPGASEHTIEDVVEFRLPLTLCSEAAAGSRLDGPYGRVHGPYLALTYEEVLATAAR
eukprot:gene1900-2583_t